MSLIEQVQLTEDEKENALDGALFDAIARAQLAKALWAVQKDLANGYPTLPWNEAYKTWAEQLRQELELAGIERPKGVA